MDADDNGDDDADDNDEDDDEMVTMLMTMMMTMMMLCVLALLVSNSCNRRNHLQSTHCICIFICICICTSICICINNQTIEIHEIFFMKNLREGSAKGGCGGQNQK